MDWFQWDENQLWILFIAEDLRESIVLLYIFIIVGTVIVEPEAVEEKTFQGPEFPSSKKKVLGLL